MEDLNGKIDSAQQEQKQLETLLGASQLESEQTSVKMAQAEIALKELA